MQCKYCGKELKKGKSYDGVYMCEACYEEHTTICDRCGNVLWNDDREGSDNLTLCNSCYENHYTHCEQCGCLISYDSALYFEDEDYPYCSNCYNQLSEETIIHSYNYKPEPVFHGENDMYMGVELEIDIGGDLAENAEKILNIANMRADNLYCKRDGSIEAGFELVTHPMSLSYHKNEMPWEKIFKKAISMGYRSHNTSTCGLHIHVDRSALGSDHNEQEDTISRIIYFVEAHWNELLKFSRRTESTIMRWASRYGIENTAKLTYDKAKKGNLGRYVCVNLQNYNTIEFRIFRGTLRYESFISALQLVHEICDKATKMTDKQFESMSWSDFVKEINKDENTELISYLKSKQLYVNDITNEEGDEI